MRAGGQDNGWQIWRYANEFDRGSNPLGSVVTCKFRSQLLTCWNYLEILRLAAGFCLAGSSSSSLTNLSRLLSRSNPFWDFVRIEDFRILLDSDSDRNGNRIENISNFRIRGFFFTQLNWNRNIVKIQRWAKCDKHVVLQCRSRSQRYTLQHGWTMMSAPFVYSSFHLAVAGRSA